MHEWSYRHRTAGLENAGVEMSGKAMYGKQFVIMLCERHRKRPQYRDIPPEQSL